MNDRQTEGGAEGGMDDLEQLEVEGIMKRRTDRVKTIEQKEKSRQGRLARNRGMSFERTAAKYFGGEKVIASGAYGSGKDGDKLSGDIWVGCLRAQCKKTKMLQGIRKILDHDGSKILIQGDPGEDMKHAIISMRAETFLAIIKTPDILREVGSE